MAPKTRTPSERPVVIRRKRTPKPVVPPALPAPTTETARPAPVPSPSTKRPPAAAPVLPAAAAPAKPVPQGDATATPRPAARPLRPAAVPLQPPKELPPSMPVPLAAAAPLEPLPPPELAPVPLTLPGADPQRAAEKQRQRRQAAEAVLQLLMARWPQTFTAYPAEVRPLALGIDKDLAAHLPGTARRSINFALALWQWRRRPAYWQALVRGGARYDLEGNPRGVVTPEEQAHARQLAADYYAQRQTRRAAAGRAQGSRPPTGPAPAGAELPDVPAPESDS